MELLFLSFLIFEVFGVTGSGGFDDVWKVFVVCPKEDVFIFSFG